MPKDKKNSWIEAAEHIGRNIIRVHGDLYDMDISFDGPSDISAVVYDNHYGNQLYTMQASANNYEQINETIEEWVQAANQAVKPVVLLS